MSRASTSSFSYARNVNGRDQPGHDTHCPMLISQAYITFFIRPQVLSADQMRRSSRKRSIGADDLIELIRYRPTPVHWNPHFSSTRREAGLVTLAPACNASCERSVKA